ncbi:hypothetical protein [Saccharopolyspora endophytica]|uniref:Uncharacterized protein n=1 Tax=Saccharopolyspora endophytica TaxID=543886 RepID=A0ABS5DDK5_9PSEU|nr:hypothetical protein [Saccharopolyspora endophytica]MBQ0924247.1 hypothetical protein [Saccharopolyspora endophytica]
MVSVGMNTRSDLPALDRLSSRIDAGSSTVLPAGPGMTARGRAAGGVHAQLVEPCDCEVGCGFS